MRRFRHRRPLGDPERSSAAEDLDLFDPSNGHWEYSAVTTNKTLAPKALWDFMAGRGMHENILGELKTGYAFNTIPTLTLAQNLPTQNLFERCVARLTRAA